MGFFFPRGVSVPVNVYVFFEGLFYSVEVLEIRGLDKRVSLGELDLVSSFC